MPVTHAYKASHDDATNQDDLFRVDSLRCKLEWLNVRKSKQIASQLHLQGNLWVANFQHSCLFRNISTNYPHSATTTATVAAHLFNFFLNFTPNEEIVFIP